MTAETSLTQQTLDRPTGDSPEKSDDFNLSLARQHYDLCENRPQDFREIAEWNNQAGVILYKAQQAINRLDSNSKNAFRLYRNQGVPVTWPGFWERRQIRKEQKRLQQRITCERNLQRSMVNEYELMEKAIADYHTPKKVQVVMAGCDPRDYPNSRITIHNRNVAMHPEMAKSLGYVRRDLL